MTIIHVETEPNEQGRPARNLGRPSDTLPGLELRDELRQPDGTKAFGDWSALADQSRKPRG